jgi:hypothetical protein
VRRAGAAKVVLRLNQLPEDIVDVLRVTAYTGSGEGESRFFSALLLPLLLGMPTRTCLVAV